MKRKKNIPHGGQLETTLFGSFGPYIPLPCFFMTSDN